MSPESRKEVRRALGVAGLSKERRRCPRQHDHPMTDASGRPRLPTGSHRLLGDASVARLDAVCIALLALAVEEKPRQQGSNGAAQ